MKTKICTKCDIKKELNKFHKSKRGKFGVRADCKECCKKRRKKYRLKYIYIIREREKNSSKEWKSITNATKTLKISDGDIVSCLKQKKYHKTAGGYIWKYKKGE